MVVHTIALVGTYHRFLLLVVWHGADAQADYSDHNHHDRYEGKHFACKTRVGVLHCFSQLVEEASLLCICSHHSSPLPPLFLLELVLHHLIHRAHHAVVAAGCHLSYIHAPVQQLSMQSYIADILQHAELPTSQEVEDHLKG